MDFIRKYAYILLGVFCVLALGGLFMATRNRPAGVMELGQPIGEARLEAAPPPESQPEMPHTPPPEEPGMIMVHMIGAVYSPGVYEVPYGSRVFQVLDLAGGHTGEADLELINLVAVVHDGLQIRIPAIGDEPQEIPHEGQPSQGTTTASVAADGRVNINLANLTELQTLPGIGPVIAQNIIDFRDANGRFNSIEDLLNVQRIGAATFENIRDRVTVE